MNSRKAEKDSPNAITGQRIRSLRRMMGLSQVKLAEKIDVTYQQLQKYETGKNNINVNMLFRISEALEHPTTSLLELNTNPATQVSEGHDKDKARNERVLNHLNTKIARRLNEIHDAGISASILKLLDTFAKPMDK